MKLKPVHLGLKYANSSRILVLLMFIIIDHLILMKLFAYSLD